LTIVCLFVYSAPVQVYGLNLDSTPLQVYHRLQRMQKIKKQRQNTENNNLINIKPDRGVI